jgi:hypothetical protein
MIRHIVTVHLEMNGSGRVKPCAVLELGRVQDVHAAITLRDDASLVDTLAVSATNWTYCRHLRNAYAGRFLQTRASIETHEASGQATTEARATHYRLVPLGPSGPSASTSDAILGRSSDVHFQGPPLPIQPLTVPFARRAGPQTPAYLAE